jgi:hypothetical protein
MRATLAAAGVALATIAAFALPAGAATPDHFTAEEFSVTGVTVAQHVSHGQLIFRDELKRHHRVVGHNKGVCHRTATRGRIRCRVVFTFPAGKIKAKGVFGGPDNKLPIIGGTGAFNGVAGKLLFQDIGSANRTRLHFFLIN